MGLVFKIVMFFGGLCLILTVGVLKSPRDLTPTNPTWVFYFDTNASTYPVFYRMWPDGSQKRGLPIRLGDYFEVLAVYDGWVVSCNYDHVETYNMHIGVLRTVFDWKCGEFSGYPPNDRWLYFTRGDTQHQTYKLYRVAFNGLHQEFVLQNPLDESFLIYQTSPDKQWLYGVSEYREYAYSRTTLIRFRRDGSDFQVLAPQDGQYWVEEWTPNHQWLVFSLKPHVGEKGLHLVRPDGSDKWRVTAGGDDRFVVWANDGHDMIYMDSDNFIRSINILTGDDRLLIPQPIYRSPIVSPDGKWLAFVLATGRYIPDERRRFGEVYLMSTDGAITRQLTFELDAGGDRIGVNFWSSDGQWLYISMGESYLDRPQLYRIRPDGTDLELVAADAQALAWVDSPTLHWQPALLIGVGLVLWGVGSGLIFVTISRARKSRRELAQG